MRLSLKVVYSIYLLYSTDNKVENVTTSIRKAFVTKTPMKPVREILSKTP